MQYLFDGVRKFHATEFQHYRELFEKLERGQKPHTLFIGCSDSRIVPTLITKTLPGELFVIRNIANIVPFYRASDDFLATTSAIEYAVKILEVENIVVCGHSNCAGCAAIFLDDQTLQNIPHTRKWLELAAGVKEKVEKVKDLRNDPLKREWITEQLNIVEQLGHLLTFPYIREKVDSGKLKIFGWYYLIPSGEIYDYDRGEQVFKKIQ